MCGEQAITVAPEHREDPGLSFERVGKRRAGLVGAALAAISQPSRGVEGVVDVEELERSKSDLKHFAWGGQEHLHRVKL